jgi:hypothetical protein
MRERMNDILEPIKFIGKGVAYTALGAVILVASPVILAGTAVMMVKNKLSSG